MMSRVHETEQEKVTHWPGLGGSGPTFSRTIGWGSLPQPVPVCLSIPRAKTQLSIQQLRSPERTAVTRSKEGLDVSGIPMWGAEGVPQGFE